MTRSLANMWHMVDNDIAAAVTAVISSYQGLAMFETISPSILAEFEQIARTKRSKQVITFDPNHLAVRANEVARGDIFINQPEMGRGHLSMVASIDISS